MSLPGFSAEASFYRPGRAYHSSSAALSQASGRGASIQPAQCSYGEVFEYTGATWCNVSTHIWYCQVLCNDFGMVYYSWTPCGSC